MSFRIRHREPRFFKSRHGEPELVTVPPSGPVRPVELAVSDATGFHGLDLD